jgi:peptide/nickel transport system permease protein
VFVVLGVLIFVFLMLQLVGDPVRLMLPAEAPESIREELRESLGLNDPLYVRFGRSIWGWVRGDFGDSLWQKTPALPVALGIALPLAIALGALSAVKPNSLIDRTLTAVSLAGVSVADFWLGLMLILIFAVELRWLPTSGYGGITYALLPALSLAFRPLGRIAQVARSALVEEMEKPYILTAQSKGLTGRAVVWRHALRNAAIPTITVTGDETATFLNGAVVIETIFAWPGIGQLFIQAIQRRDVPLIEACVFVVALLTITLNLLVDLSYAAIDSRARIQK